MAVTNVAALPNQWSDWYKSENAYLVGGSPLSEALSLGFIPDTDVFNGPFVVQVLYASDTGYEMQQQVFTSADDFAFDIAANTAGHVYFRVASAGPLPVGVRVTDDQVYEVVAENEVPEWTPLNPEYPLLPTPSFGSPEPYGPWVAGVLDDFGDSETIASPIVLDIDASGTIELTALNGAGDVYWDIDQDGFREASGWITGGDGLLAIDLNSDGVINDHGELFGGANGYVTLDAYDTNNDNAITAADTDFGDLLVWVDADADGFSESAELHTLTSLGITSIATTYSNVNYQIAGNQISYQSTFVMNGNTYTSVDAFFAYDTTNTVYAEEYTLDARTLYLPTLRGYGHLPDLHIAMSLDEDLLDLVTAFVTSDMADIMAAALDPINGSLRDVLFQWAGVESVAANSRGNYIDARILGFLEALTGQAFVGTGGSNPGTAAADLLMDGWQKSYEAIAARIVYQALDLSGIFSGGQGYDPVADDFLGVSGIDLATIEDRMDAHTAWGEKYHFAKALIFTINNIIGIGNLSSQDHDDLESVLPDGVSIEAIQHAVIGSGSLFGDAYDNLIIGSSGSTTLTGYSENDVLDGGAGDDTLRGGVGDDTYVFAAGYGQDEVEESLSSGTDALRMAGFDAADIRMWTTNTALKIASRSNPADVITIGAATTLESGTTHETKIGLYLESVQFDDATWSLAGGLTLEGSSSNDNIYGSQYSDTIGGMGGADTLYGNRGNDTLTGGAGNDTLRGGAGDDTYVFAAGFGADDVIEATSSGTDLIRMSGYNASDVRLSTGSTGQLFVTSKASPGDTVTVSGGETLFSGTTNETLIGLYLESLVFDDATWSLTGGLTLEGSSSGESIYGSQYNDSIKGMDGADTLYGNRGNDTLTGGAGNDTLRGGADDDTYVFATGFGADDIIEATSSGTDLIQMSGYNASDVRLSTGSTGQLFVTSKASPGDTVTVSGGETLFSGTTNETLIGLYLESIQFDDVTWDLTGGLTLEGSSSGDSIYGSQYNDSIKGMDGADTLYGNRGDDTLVGGDGGDTLNGGDGDDILYGNAGSDTLTGGNGADTYVFQTASAFSNTDTVSGFSTAQGDKIDLHDVLDAAFDPVSHLISLFVNFTNSGSNSIMSIDRDGAGSTYGFTNVATLTGVNNLDETTLYNNGHLLAA